MRKKLDFILVPVLTIVITWLAEICIKPLEMKDIEESEE